MVYRELSEVESGDLSRRILFEDNHLLILNKRVGEIVQGDKTGDEPLSETLKAFIAQRDSKPGHVFIGVPHRLDRPVSGVAVFAKTSKCLERLNVMFRDGDVHKVYWALCCSRPEPAEGELVHWITRNEKMNKSFATAKRTVRRSPDCATACCAIRSATISSKWNSLQAVTIRSAASSRRWDVPSRATLNTARRVPTVTAAFPSMRGGSLSSILSGRRRYASRPPWTGLN